MKNGVIYTYIRMGDAHPSIKKHAFINKSKK